MTECEQKVAKAMKAFTEALTSGEAEDVLQEKLAKAEETFGRLMANELAVNDKLSEPLIAGRNIIHRYATAGKRIARAYNMPEGPRKQQATKEATTDMEGVFIDIYKYVEDYKCS